jgi:serine/threonine protein phosphatase PrpC
MKRNFPSIDVASIGSKTRTSGLNEDAIAYSVFDSFQGKAKQQIVVACVADGMTTLALPHLASSYAVQNAMTTFFSSHSPLNERPFEMLIAANNFLLNHPTKQDFGTTLTAVVAADGMIYIATLGDDRVYQISDSRIACLTRDHSRLAEQLGRNPTREEVKSNQKSKKLARSLGEKPFGADYIFAHSCPVKHGDVFIICTDGLWTEFDEQELLSLTTEDTMAISLAEIAVERDDTDDVSVALLRF